MNGYKLMADSYRKLTDEGKITMEMADKETRIYDFLATCSQDDFCRMVDSSAFNDIIKAYLRMAVRNAEIDEKAEDKVMNEIRFYLMKRLQKRYWNKLRFLEVNN